MIDIIEQLRKTHKAMKVHKKITEHCKEHGIEEVDVFTYMLFKQIPDGNPMMDMMASVISGIMSDGDDSKKVIDEYFAEHPDDYEVASDFSPNLISYCATDMHGTLMSDDEFEAMLIKDHDHFISLQDLHENGAVVKYRDGSEGVVKPDFGGIK